MAKKFTSDINPGYYITAKGFRDNDPDVTIQIVESDEITGAVSFKSEDKARKFVKSVEKAIAKAFGEGE